MAKAAAKAAAKAPAKVDTVTLKHIAATLAETHEIPKKQAVAVLEDMIAHIAKNLKKGNRIRIGGLGVLQVRKRPARMGRNPATGEAIKIKAAKNLVLYGCLPAFRFLACQRLSSHINSAARYRISHEH